MLMLRFAGERLFQPQHHAIQKAQLSRKPGQAIRKHQSPDKQEQRAARYFDGVKVLSEALVKTKEAAQPQCRQDKRDGQSGGINGEKKNSAGDRVAGGGNGQNGGENRPDAGSPAKSKSKAHQEPAPGAGLAAEIPEMNVAVQPAGQHRAQKKNHRDSQNLNRSETSAGESRPRKQQPGSRRKNRSHNQPGANRNLREEADQVQPEQYDQRSRNWRQQVAVAHQKLAYRAGRCAKGNEHHRKAADKR